MRIFEQMTPVNKRKIISRISIFMTYSLLGIIDMDLIIIIANINIGPLKIYHLLWFFLAGFFAFNLFYIPSQKISSGRQYLKFYEANPKCSSDLLKKEVQINNSRAKKAAVYILLINGTFIYIVNFSYNGTLSILIPL